MPRAGAGANRTISRVVPGMGYLAICQIAAHQTNDNLVVSSFTAVRRERSIYNVSRLAITLRLLHQ